MKILLAFAAVALTFCAPISRVSASQKPVSSTRSAPQSRVLKVTEKNFVSLTFDVSGGFAGLKSQLALDRQHMIYSASRRPTITARWTKQMRAPLFHTLNEARFPALVGNYRQKYLNDGFNETVTLKVRDGKIVRTFVVQNYGDRAPKAYYKVSAWLRNFQQQRFPANGATTFNADAPNS